MADSTTYLSGLIRPILLSTLILGTAVCHGEISVVPQNPTLSATWDDGTLVLQQDFCVSSISGGGGGPPGGPPGGGQQRPYDVTAAGPFTVTSGSESLPFAATWIDTDRNVSYQLEPGITTPRELSGNPANCDNARLEITIAENDLNTALPGSYTRNLQLTLDQGNGRPPTTVTIDAALDITVPDRVRISGLDDINLGRFDGINDLQGGDALCVFRGSGGTYTVTLTGNGTGGSFQLSNGDSDIPYSAFWDDGSGASSVSAGTPLSGQQADAFGGDTRCGGATNATVEVSVATNDAEQARPGPHTGVLTILVEME